MIIYDMFAFFWSKFVGKKENNCIPKSRRIFLIACVTANDAAMNKLTDHSM
jgi:hypothetical protein